MSTITIAAPCCANNCAAARPCPDPDPVMSATRPASCCCTSIDRTQVGPRPSTQYIVGVADDPIEQYGALFERDGERFAPTPLARGPWDPNALHGGAPSALFAWACERHDPSPAAFMARLTVELMRPVPLAPLQLSVRSIRPGRKVHWLEASPFDEDDREVARP